MLVTRIHPQEIELGANNLSGLFGIGGGTSSAAKDVGGEVVDFFAVFSPAVPDQLAGY